ncbi:hypothetical protein F4680DRAFT_263997 [Xylaria scruposa]|nr:hypothetical protein F4680DRAFT_263997 [Xylaria scruposa]
MKCNIVKITTWPFRATRQAWKDFQRGRQIRIIFGQENKQEAQEKQAALPETERSRGETSQSPASQQYILMRPQPMGPQQGTWTLQCSEYPWRLELLTHIDHNTRGTWVLEAKDVSAIVWEQGYRMKGSWLKTETVPQPSSSQFVVAE